MSAAGTYLRLHAVRRRFGAAAAAIYNGLWLGALGPDRVRDVSVRAYNATVEGYRDADYNLSGLVTWETDALAAGFPSSGRLLVGGAGGGREALALAKAGYDVLAFECAIELADLARSLVVREGLTDRLDVVDSQPDHVPPVDGSFAGAVVGWAAYTHIAGRLARVAFLRQIAAVLEPSAPLLVSFIVRHGDERSLRLVHRAATLTRSIGGWSDGPQLGDDLNGRFDHRFTEHELRDELRAAGFVTVSYAERPYGWALARPDAAQSQSPARSNGS